MTTWNHGHEADAMSPCEACRVLAARSERRAEGLREALQAIIDLRTVVPDHPHGGIHPPYLEWLKVADIARRALAATPPVEGLDVERLARAYAEAGYGGVLSDEEWQDIAREYAALAPEQPE